MTTAQFSYRQTGGGIFQVDAGELHLGTVQQFSKGVWWAYPAGSAGQVSLTLPSREQAAEALLQHHAATASVQGSSITLKSNHQCRICRHWIEGDWNAAPTVANREYFQRLMDRGFCDKPACEEKAAAIVAGADR